MTYKSMKYTVTSQFKLRSIDKFLTEGIFIVTEMNSVSEPVRIVRVGKSVKSISPQSSRTHSLMVDYVKHSIDLESYGNYSGLSFTDWQEFNLFMNTIKNNYAANRHLVAGHGRVAGK